MLLKTSLFVVAFFSFIAFESSQAATVNGFELAPYGFLKSSAMYADEALASYNNVNLSAPTHAVAQTRSQDKTSRFSFQTQQSRFGTTIAKDKLSGRFEFDFIDFNKSSPTTQMVPRVRIASVTYQWDNNKVVIGQDWDLFSPVTTYTFDYVGLYFMAGNSGFMRQQAQYLKTLGEWELGAALGMAGNNPGVTDADLEFGKSPSYSARISKNIEGGRFGISGIYSTLHYTSTNGYKTDAYGANAFFEKKYNTTFAVKSEAYYGQNLGNIGALTIGKGTNVKDVREFGGTLTGTYALNEVSSLFGGAGFAKVDNKSEITPFSFGTGSTANLITNPGVSSNFLSRAGYEYKVTPDFSWISEVSRYETESKIADDRYQTNIAYSLESGVQFRF